MVSLRNLVIGVLRLHGCHNIAAAPRRSVRDATRLLSLLGITSHETDTPARCRCPVALLSRVGDPFGSQQQDLGPLDQRRNTASSAGATARRQRKMAVGDGRTHPPSCQITSETDH
jgi:hypothetical protein